MLAERGDASAKNLQRVYASCIKNRDDMRTSVDYGDSRDIIVRKLFSSSLKHQRKIIRDLRLGE